MSNEDLVRRLREGTFGTDETKTDCVINAYMSRAANTIERLTRERDDCREDYLRESKIAAGYAGALFRAERKVEKLRGLLKEILEFVDDPYDEIAIYIGNALAETEKGDD